MTCTPTTGRVLDLSIGQAGSTKREAKERIEYKTFHRNGHVAVVDTLLTAGVPADATDHKGLTPLMMACMFGRSMMSAYLLGKVRNNL